MNPLDKKPKHTAKSTYNHKLARSARRQGKGTMAEKIREREAKARMKRHE